jgi:hypothetical protein
MLDLHYDESQPTLVYNAEDWFSYALNMFIPMQMATYPMTIRVNHETILNIYIHIYAIF